MGGGGFSGVFGWEHFSSRFKVWMEIEIVES